MITITICIFIVTWGAGVRGGRGGPLFSSSPAAKLMSVSSLPGVSTSSMSHTFGFKSVRLVSFEL